MGIPASMRVLKPFSSVLNEFQVTTMGLAISSVKATMSSAKRSVSRPEGAGEADDDDVDVRGRRR